MGRGTTPPLDGLYLAGFGGIGGTRFLVHGRKVAMGTGDNLSMADFRWRVSCKHKNVELDQYGISLGEGNHIFTYMIL